MTRVLIVEDEPDLADPLAYLLAGRGTKSRSPRTDPPR